jgi:hypothetical protein
MLDFPKSKGPLRIWELASKILFASSLESYLFVNLCKLFQVVLKKGNLLFLGMNPPTVLGLHFCTLVRERRKDVAVLRPNGSHSGQTKPAPQRAANLEKPEERRTV